MMALLRVVTYSINLDTHITHIGSSDQNSRISTCSRMEQVLFHAAKAKFKINKG